MERHLQQPIRYPNMPLLLLKARDGLLQHFRPILNHYGVTEQQWRIMRALSEAQMLEPRELCDLCQISSPSMSGILARMEETGWLARSKFEGDQRRRQVQLSRAGAGLMNEMGRLIDLQYENLEAAYGKQVFEDMRLALEAFVALEDVPVAPAQAD
jgi:homoprotocatechuate degradation regulator HpaR